MSWFSRVRAPKPSAGEEERLQLPGGLWSKCPSCSAVIYTKELTRSVGVCPKCQYHFPLSADERIDLLCDRNTFEEIDRGLRSSDPLSFKDSQRYRERLKKYEKQVGEADAVKTGRCKINGRPAMLGVMNFKFMGGSMGIVVGERLARMVEMATRDRLPAIIVSASGGARMQEGIFSLMQMAKVSAALEKQGQKGLPYISILTHPTTGGVAASFAMLGDINIAEPGALIGFAGPRVIEQTIKRKLPEGFQRSEFLLEHGMVDLIAPRHELKNTVGNILELLWPKS